MKKFGLNRKAEEEKKKKEDLQKRNLRNFRKNEIFGRQANLRRQQLISRDYNVSQNERKVREVLRDMCDIGSIIKDEILEERKRDPSIYIPISEATDNSRRKEGVFCLGLLAQNLENMGITTAIERNPRKDEYSQNESNTILQFIMNGLMEKQKYDLHFDFGGKRNNELLYNIKEQEQFNQKLLKLLSLEYNIPEEKIIITNPQEGSYGIQVIFQTDDFNNKNIIDINKLKEKYKNNKDFEEISHLKQVHKRLIMEGCRLNNNMLDSRGNRESGWGQNEKRGGFNYIPPYEGWKGYGLNVWGKYDNGNNDWLAYNGNKNEWAIAYHGIGVKLGTGFTLEKVANNIIKGGFKAGAGQAFANCNDVMHPGQKVGIGVYCSPDPRVMEEYAKGACSSLSVNGKKYIMGFMMRVKPDRIRYAKEQEDYWVLNGTTEEMRPYRIMIKEL